MHIDPQAIEKALYDFLFEQVRKDPAYFRHMVEEVMEDYALGKLMQDAANDPDNGSVPNEDLFALLDDKCKS